MASSVQLWNENRQLQDQQAAVPQNARDREERIFRLDGRIEEGQNRLSATLAAEDNARVMPDGTLVSLNDPNSLSVQALGPRSSFTGLKPGFRGAITVPTGPTVVDPTVPGFGELPRGFAETLMQAPTDAGVTYLRRGARINAASQWSDGSDKPESTYTWTEQSAPLAWIPHHVPIAKTQASDWGQLDSIIRGEMMLGLRAAKSREALVGANPSGLTGVLNTPGIQVHTLAAGDNAYDAIRRMATRVFVVSGFPPSHVAVSPEVDEALDLLKDENKAYLKVKAAGRVWQLEIVLDAGLAVHDPAEGLTHHGVLVYSNIGATFHTKETDSIEVGLVGDQFINNAYTLLAEGRFALSVRYPDAFCYMQDAIASVADASS